MKIEVQTKEEIANECWKDKYPHLGEVTEGHFRGTVLLFFESRVENRITAKQTPSSAGIVLRPGPISGGTPSIELLFYKTSYKRFEGKITLEND